MPLRIILTDAATGSARIVLPNRLVRIDIEFKLITIKVLKTEALAVADLDADVIWRAPPSLSSSAIN
jgi:hypothetical protein